MICSRCKKESDENFFGMCIGCVANNRPIEKITDKVILIPPYCWIYVENSGGRYCVINESTFDKLLNSNSFNFDLELSEDNYEIYLKDTDELFKKYLSELYGTKLRFNNVYDFRIREKLF